MNRSVFIVRSLCALETKATLLCLFTILVDDLHNYFFSVRARESIYFNGGTWHECRARGF